jgi:glycosyltransferase domain-containing protein
MKSIVEPKLNKLTKLSVIFLTKNRYSYLTRNLRLWEKSGAMIYVLDSSDKSMSHQFVREFPNVVYIHMDAPLEARVFAVQKLITTTYSMLASDDDIVTLSGAEACIEELDGNPDLVAVSGIPIGFKVNAKKVNYFEIYPTYKRYGSSLNLSPWIRVFKHFNHYESSSVYGIVRSEAFKKVCRVFKDSTHLPNNLFELIFEFSITFLGRVKVIDQLYWLRSQECVSNWTNEVPNAEFSLLIKYPGRAQLLSNLNDEILSKNLNCFSKIRIQAFLLILTGRELSNFCNRLKIRTNYRWLLLLPLFLYTNLDPSIKNRLLKLKRRIKIGKLKSEITGLNESCLPPSSFSENVKQMHNELYKYTELIESFGSDANKSI